MHFNFPVTSVLKNEINKVILNDISGFQRGRNPQKSLMAIIVDHIGKMSAEAQGLPHQITAADKLKDDQTVYLLIDPYTDHGNGELIGLLKIGLKNLYLHDGKGNIHQRKCQCILDFYVDDTKQRMGYGKRLYDFMLEDLGMEARMLPIDKPSPKLLQFLKKHYNLSRPINQNNNYVVYDVFFAGGIVQPSYDREPPAVMEHHGRYSAAQPQTTMGMIIQNGMN